MSDRRAGARLVAGLSPLWPTIRTVIADAGHESCKLRTVEVKRHEGWRLVIVKRSEPAFKIVGLNWIVERTFGWLRPAPPPLEGLRVQGADLGDSDRDCSRSIDARAARNPINFSHRL